MSPSGRAASAGAGGSGVPAVVGASVAARSVPDRARGLAGQLSALFERDVEIVGRLNDAQRRLRAANQRLLMAGVSAAGGAMPRWR
jgi:hypothetical protein